MIDSTLEALLDEIEAAIDAHPGVTRKRTSGLDDEAELVFDRSGWTARCAIRGLRATGRGAKMPISAKGMGTTPEMAAKHLIAGLDAWSQVLNNE